MSTELESIGRIHLLRFWGGDKHGVCLQITCYPALYAEEENYIRITLDEVEQLEQALHRTKKHLENPRG